MNPLDAVLLVIIGINLVLGLFRGAVFQVLRLTGIALGIWVALNYGEEFLAMWPDGMRTDESWGKILAQGVLFLSVYLVIFGISHLLRSLIKKIELGSLDKILGGLVGAAKGALFASLLLYLQFIPFVTNIDSVKTWLYGDRVQGIEASVGNRIFIEHVKSRVDGVVPDELTDKVEGYVNSPNSSLRPR